MTPAQKKNAAKFKKVQTIAKGLKKKNPKLSHLEAVKKAWDQIRKPGSKKVGNVTLKKANYHKNDDRYIIMNDGKKHLDGKPFFKETAKEIATSLRKVKAKRKVASKKVGYAKVRTELQKKLTKAVKSEPKTLFPYTKKQQLIKAGKKMFTDMEKNLHNHVSGVHKIRPFTLTELKKLHPDFFRKGYEHYFGVKAKKIIVSDKLNCQVYLEKIKYTDQPYQYTARQINPDGSFKSAHRVYHLDDLIYYIGKKVTF